MAAHGSEPKLPEEREIEWTPYAELHLLNALGGLKAIGVNHHFCMAVVWQRFTSAMHVNVSSEYLRKHLETFYDFGNAERLVGEVPFPNEEEEFRLPAEEFPGLFLGEAEAEGEAGRGGTTPVAARVREMILAKKVALPAHSPLRRDDRKKDEKFKKEEKRKFEPPKEERKDIKKEMPKFFEKKLLKDRPIVKLTKSIIEETPAKRLPSSSKEAETRKGQEAAKKRSRTSESEKSGPVAAAKRARH